MGFEHLEYGELRESSSQNPSYSRIKSKRFKQRSFAFVAHKRALLQAHGFKHLSKFAVILKYVKLPYINSNCVHAILIKIFFPCTYKFFSIFQVNLRFCKKFRTTLKNFLGNPSKPFANTTFSISR